MMQQHPSMQQQQQAPIVPYLMPNDINTSEMQTKLALLIDENEKLKKENHELSSKKVSIADVLDYIDNAPMPNITKAGRILLKDLIEASLSKAQGRRYSETSKEIAFILNCKSSKCYSTLRCYLPFPCLNTIKNAFSKDVKKGESSLLDPNKVKDIITDYYHAHCKENKVRATMAVDAISISPNEKSGVKASLGSIAHKVDEQYEFYKKNLTEEQRTEFMKNEAPIDSVFIFYLEPHDPYLPCIPVHIFLKHGGNASKPVQVLVDTIISLINSTQLVYIKNFSSDGDLGYQQRYDKSFEDLLKLSPDMELDKILNSEAVYQIEEIASADLLHAFKVLRIRFLLNNINIIPDEKEHIANKDTIKNLFKDGKELTDLSPVGKMRDSYALAFFFL